MANSDKKRSNFIRKAAKKLCVAANAIRSQMRMRKFIFFPYRSTQKKTQTHTHISFRFNIEFFCTNYPRTCLPLYIIHGCVHKNCIFLSKNSLFAYIIHTLIFASLFSDRQSIPDPSYPNCRGRYKSETTVFARVPAVGDATPNE